MDQPQPDNKLMIQYLLGSLPEEETERLDELSFIDDEFAARLEAVENDLVDTYVRGELSGRELAQFNSHYLASPIRRERVKFAQTLQAFAKQTIITVPAQSTAQAEPSQPEQTPAPISTKPASWWHSLFSLFTVPTPALQWSFAAAALLMLLIGGWFMLETIKLRRQFDQAQSDRAALQQKERELQEQIDRQRTANTQAADELKQVRERLAQLEQQQAEVRPPLQPSELSIAHLDLAPQTRGSTTTLSIPPGTDYLAIQLELEGDDYPRFRAELWRQGDDQNIWISQRLKARVKNNGKVIDVNIRANLLVPGGYVIRLKGITSEGKIEDARSYSFRIVKQ